MPLLFSYGTLQEADVQRALFDRHLEGTSDALVGFVPGQVPILDREAAQQTGRSFYDNIIPTHDPTNRVVGVAFEVSDAELLRADGYESPAGYERITTILGSGRTAWVYLNRGRIIEPE